MVFVRGVGAVDARSAALGPRFCDGLAETSDRGFIRPYDGAPNCGYVLWMM